jgi:hypothetical protein
VVGDALFFWALWWTMQRAMRWIAVHLLVSATMRTRTENDDKIPPLATPCDSGLRRPMARF